MAIKLTLETFFQLHTVHQELSYFIIFRRQLCGFQLHTVHQEPIDNWFLANSGIPPFNSTRYIRNTLIQLLMKVSRSWSFQLHTVHQEPGEIYEEVERTLFIFQLHTVHQELKMKEFIKTATKIFQLHTVHQELWKRVRNILSCLTFNSTRYIRNPKRPH